MAGTEILDQLAISFSKKLVAEILLSAVVWNKFELSDVTEPWMPTARQFAVAMPCVTV